MVTFTAYARANFGNLDLFGAFDENSDFSHNPATQSTRFVVVPDPAELPNAKLVVTGVNFQYIGDLPFQGTIKTATLFNTAGSGPDKPLYKIAGLDLTPLEAAAFANQDPFVVANEIFSGADTINGSRFGDFLCGFGGRDTLRGGAGKDTYYFNAELVGANVDHIKSFVVADDTIGLDHEVFKKLGVDGTLKSANFKDITNGIRFQDDNDRILYNNKTGVVYYDGDGKGGDAKIAFAILDNDPVINNKDFELY